MKTVLSIALYRNMVYNRNVKISNTNWNFYKYFIVVYEAHSLNRAAEIIGVSPSAVMQNIRTLSNQIGATLFIASKKGVEPTEKAVELYSQIKNAVDIITQAENKVEVFDGQSSGSIKVAAQSWIASTYISKYLKEFCAKYPKIKVTIVQSEDVDLLIQGKLDLMVEADCLFKGRDVKTVDILGMDITGHFFASKDFVKKHGLSKTLSKDELFRYPLIERNEAWEEYKKMIGSDFVPREINVSSIEQTISMVKNGVGIGCFGDYLLNDLLKDPDFVRLEVTDLTLPTVRYVCAYSKTITRPARVFLDGLVAFCKN